MWFPAQGLSARRKETAMIVLNVHQKYNMGGQLSELWREAWGRGTQFLILDTGD